MVLSSCQGEPPAGSEPGRLTSRGDDVAGIHNYSQIDESSGFAGSPVGFGGATQASAMPWLKGEGFSTVINLRAATEEGVDLEGCRAAAAAAGLNYVHLPFDPGSGDTQVVDDFLAAVGDEANQPVYVHCNTATRVAALWMIGRVLRDGWEFDAAREEGDEIAAKPVEANVFVRKYLASRE